MTDLDGQASSDALDELAAETAHAFDQAVDATAELAHGKTVTKVEQALQAELRRRSIEPADTRLVAEQIVAGLSPMRASLSWSGARA